MKNTKPVNILFSNSSCERDIHFKNRLQIHLSNLNRNEQVNIWDESEVLVGEKIELKQRLLVENANIIIILLSPDYIASDYHFNVQLPKILERNEFEDLKLVPILIFPCDWKNTPFSRFQPLTSNGKHITIDDSEEELDSVTNKITQLISLEVEDEFFNNSENIIEVKSLLIPVNSFESTFDTYFGQDINPVTLLGEFSSQQRNGFRDDFYIERSAVDGKLFNLLKSNKNIFLTGKVLSGKSRAIYFLINKHLKGEKIHVLRDLKYFEKFELSKISISIKGIREKEYFIINDIDEYVNNPKILDLIEELLKNENICLITTCKYFNFLYVKNGLNQLYQYFSEVIIPPLSQEEKKILSLQIIGNDNLIKGDTIGSYFVGLRVIQKRYELSSEREKEFLRSYKVTKLAFRTSVGEMDTLIKLTQDRLRYLHGDNSIVFTPKEAFGIRDKLVGDGLIKKRGNKVLIEDSYVDKIISIDETEESLANSLIKSFPTEDTYNKLIERVSSESLSISIFKKMKEDGLSYSSYTLHSLLVRKNSFEDGIKLFKEIEASKTVSINKFTFITLIQLAENYEQAWSIILLYDSYNEIELDEIAWYTFFKKFRSISKENLMLLRDKLNKENFRLNLRSYNKLIAACEDNDLAFELYNEIITNELVPNEKTISGLLSSACEYENVLSVYLEARRHEIKIDRQFINSCFNRIKNFDQSQEFFNQLNHESVRVPSYSLNLLISRSEDYDFGITLLKNLPFNQRIENIVFNSVIKLAKNFSQSNAVLELMELRAIRLSLNSLNLVLRTIYRFNDALNFVNERFKDDVAPDSYTYYFLTEKARTFHHALSIFKNSVENGIEPNQQNYRMLIKKARPVNRDDRNVMEVFKIIEKSNSLFPDSSTMWMILNQTRQIENSWKVYHWLKSRGVIPSHAIFNAILQNCTQYKEAMDVHSEISSLGMTPSPKNYSLVIKAHRNYEDAWNYYEKIKTLNFDIDIFPFNYLMYKAPDEEECLKIFKEAIEVNAITNTDKRDQDYLFKFLIIFIRKSYNFHVALNAYNEYRRNGGPARIELLDVMLLVSKDRDSKSMIFEIIDAEMLDYSVDTYNQIIFMQKGVLDSVEILDEMFEANISPNDYTFKNVIFKSHNDESLIENINLLGFEYSMKISTVIYKAICRKARNRNMILLFLLKAYSNKDEKYFDSVSKLEDRIFLEKVFENIKNQSINP